MNKELRTAKITLETLEEREKQLKEKETIFETYVERKTKRLHNQSLLMRRKMEDLKNKQETIEFDENEKEESEMKNECMGISDENF